MHVAGVEGGVVSFGKEGKETTLLPSSTHTKFRSLKKKEFFSSERKGMYRFCHPTPQVIKLGDLKAYAHTYRHTYILCKSLYPSKLTLSALYKGSMSQRRGYIQQAPFSPHPPHHHQ